MTRAVSSVRRKLCAALMGLPLASAAGHAAAEGYPAKAIRLIVPFPAGGVTDSVARVSANLLADRLGQPVLVDNRPGGNTLIGANLVATAAADGYTLLFVGGAGLSSVFNKKPPFDMWKALTPVGGLYEGTYYLFVNPSLPVTTPQELVAYSKAKPGQLSYGASGAQTMLAMEGFKAATGADLTYIPYKGSSEVTNALVGNQIQAFFDSISSNRAMANTGRIRVIASAAASRQAEDPKVPTLKESGIHDVAAVFRGGVWAPAGTPSPVVERLNLELNAIQRMPQFLERLKFAAVVPMGGSPDDFGRAIRAELELWKRAAAFAKYEPE